MKSVLFILLAFFFKYSYSQNTQDSLYFIDQYAIAHGTKVFTIVSFNDYKISLKKQLIKNKKLYVNCISFLTERIKKDRVIEDNYFVDLNNYYWTSDIYPGFEKCLTELLLSEKLSFKDEQTTYSFKDIQIFEEPYYACNDTANEIISIDYVIKSASTGKKLVTFTKTYLEGYFRIRSCF